jgi:hypothetical protein
MQKLIVLRLIPLLFVSHIYVFLFFSDKYEPLENGCKDNYEFLSSNVLSVLD